ncbi:hypothetical protein Cgig2_015857 [Carnegiea gigantea]|uniref:Uncharacterized protein n=1 Tax=Carnegiea gigantea TaxID=171969 RepID=A0A9Q1GU95_9CARY|nr:hypothetical protein Cgig2_015857 [Carnegiea gigantea]
MPLDRSFPDYIDFSIENNVLIRQRVHYEWLPLMCSHYAQFKEIVKYHIEKKGQGSALKEDIKRHHYVTITHSALALMKQQSKVEWIGFGDECSRHFIAKIKQRKSMQCIYQIKDKNDQWVEGIIGFTEGQLPLRYLRMPIISSRLSKLECRTLVEKISGMITTWSSGHISYAGKVVYPRQRIGGLHTKSYAQDIWKKVLANWGIQMNVEGKDQYITSLKKMHQARRMKGFICAITRNMLMFKGRLQTPAQTVKAIRDQVTQSFAAPSSQSYI